MYPASLKCAQVISENVRIAFLYVLSIFHNLRIITEPRVMSDNSSRSEKKTKTGILVQVVFLKRTFYQFY